MPNSPQTHNWWLEIRPDAKKAFDRLRSGEKNAVFHSLETLLQSENPAYVQGIDIMELKSQRGVFRLKIGDQRIFYVFDDREVTLYGHVFKGIITITTISRRTEDTYRP